MLRGLMQCGTEWEEGREGEGALGFVDASMATTFCITRNESCPVALVVKSVDCW